MVESYGILEYKDGWILYSVGFNSKLQANECIQGLIELHEDRAVEDYRIIAIYKPLS